MKVMLCRLFKRVGIEVTSHDFRHGKLSDIGKYLTPQEVRDYAGHSSVSVTDRYLHTSREEVFRKIVSHHHRTVQQQVKEAKMQEVILPSKRARKQVEKEPAEKILEERIKRFHDDVAESVKRDKQYTFESLRAKSPKL